MPDRPPVHHLFRAQRKEHETRRGSARDRGYTVRWERARLAYLAEHPVCIGCQSVGRGVVGATVVDHIVPHKGDQARFWDPSNWQACCRHCHDALKSQLEAAWEAGRIGSDSLRLDSPFAISIARQVYRVVG